MNFFIIGSTGSIGQELVPKLVEHGHKVVGLTRSQTNANKLKSMGGKSINGDVSQSQDWQTEASKADVLINLISLPATRGGKPWVKKFSLLNKAASFGLLEAAKKGGKCQSFIVPSLAHLAGDHGDMWIDETTPPTAHPIFKAYAPSEEAVTEAQRLGIPAVSLRLGSIYSANPQGTFGKAFLASIAKGQFRYPGKGENYFPLVSMSDATDAIILAAEQSVSAPFLYVVDDEPIQLREVAKLIARGFGREAKSIPKSIILLMAGEALGGAITGSFRVKNTKAKSMLEWQPKQPMFRNEVKSLVADYKKLVNGTLSSK